MKSRLLLTGITVAATVFSMVSCKQDPVKESELIIDQEVVEFGEEGGTGKITYTLLNMSETSQISLEGMPEWISDPVTSVSGEISFTVAENTGDTREAVLTVVCGSLAGEFTVRQNAFTLYPKAEDIVGKQFYATWCQFYPDETYMFKFSNSSSYVVTDENGNYVYLTMGDWAQDYIDKYNADNPGASATVDDVMAFDFTDNSGGYENYMYIKTDTETGMECWSGSKTEYGNVAVLDIKGNYTYDETTGIMVVNDTGSNTTYSCTATIQFKRISNKVYEFQILSYEDYKWSDGSPIDGHPYQPWQNVFGGDCFPFMLYDYSDDAYSWIPCGKMVYTCNVLENV